VKLLDAPSWLWRAELAGHPRDHARWQVLHEFAHRAFPRPGVPFADWHVALIDAVVGDATAAEARAREIDEMVRSARYSAGPTVPAIARAFAAFQRHDFSTAIDEIESVFSERERICGSRAQLDLVEFTLLKAYLATGRLDDVRRLREACRPGPRGIPVAGLDVARSNRSWTALRLLLPSEHHRPSANVSAHRRLERALQHYRPRWQRNRDRAPQRASQTLRWQRPLRIHLEL